MRDNDMMRELSAVLQDNPAWCLLKFLMKYGKAPVRQLAAECQMPVSKVLEILRQLEAKGLVELTVENHHQYARLKNVSR